MKFLILVPVNYYCPINIIDVQKYLHNIIIKNEGKRNKERRKMINNMQNQQTKQSDMSFYI